MNFKKNLVLSFVLTLFIISITMLSSIPNNITAEPSCISYNSQENEIYISCNYIEFIDIANSLQDQSVLFRESNDLNQTKLDIECWYHC